MLNPRGDGAILRGIIQGQKRLIRDLKERAEKAEQRLIKEKEWER